MYKCLRGKNFTLLASITMVTQYFNITVEHFNELHFHKIFCLCTITWKFYDPQITQYDYNIVFYQIISTEIYKSQLCKYLTILPIP